MIEVEGETQVDHDEEFLLGVMMEDIHPGVVRVENSFQVLMKFSVEMVEEPKVEVLDCVERIELNNHGMRFGVVMLVVLIVVVVL